jgi:hypothetical protein
MQAKKLFASVTLGAFAMGGAMALEGAAQASTTAQPAAAISAQLAKPKVCKFKVRHVNSRLNVRKFKKTKGKRIRVHQPIGYLKPHEKTAGVCKTYRGWNIVAGHKMGKPKKMVFGASWHYYLKKGKKIKK